MVGNNRGRKTGNRAGDVSVKMDNDVSLAEATVWEWYFETKRPAPAGNASTGHAFFEEVSDFDCIAWPSLPRQVRLPTTRRLEHVARDHRRGAAANKGGNRTSVRGRVSGLPVAWHHRRRSRHAS